jgi:hypothetical protein
VLIKRKTLNNEDLVRIIPSEGRLLKKKPDFTRFPAKSKVEILGLEREPWS